MPRCYRIDWENAVHHVMARGIEKCDIFRDDHDRACFVKRLEECVKHTHTRIMAWALMPNHVHLLLRTGQTPLYKFVHKLLTGHAVYFNRRYDRVGHLFQNRYKSILVQSEKYFMKLVRYIHMNPVKTGIVSSIEALNEYPWTGHFGLLNANRYRWQDKESVLQEISSGNRTMISSYLEFMNGTEEDGTESLLETGTFLLGSHGINRAISANTEQAGRKYQFSVLGDIEYAKFIYDKATKGRKGSLRVRASEHEKVELILDYASRKWGISRRLIRSGTRFNKITKARELASFILAYCLGLNFVDCGRILNVTSEGARLAANRFSKSDECETILRELDNLVN